MIITTNATVIALVGTYVVPVLLPIVVGLVTTKMTNSGVKAGLLAALSILTATLTGALDAWQAGAAFDLVGTLPTSLATFTIAVATHYGLWKPAGVSEIAQSSGVRALGKHEA